MTHKLKTWPECFEKVYSLDKLFEVRKNDRNFKVGDTLYGGSFGIEQGYCVMSLSVGIW